MLELVRDGNDYEILFEGEQLMSSWASRSEKALATLAFAELDRAPELVLIGGLGMGFTLGAALAVLPPTASIVVAELVPGVVAWARGPLAPIVGSSLEDRRVTVVVRDVHDLIATGRDRYDIILLDVDNGPDGLVSAGNERLYCAWGLRAAHAALTPGGVLAVWSADPEPAFTRLLTAAGFSVALVSVDSGGARAAHTLWLAKKAGALR